MELTPTIDLLELVWTALAVGGVLLTMQAITLALEDLRWCRKHFSADSVEVSVASDNLRTEFFRFGVKVCFTTIGAVALMLPPRAEDLTTDWQLQVALASRWLSPAALLLAVSLLMIDSILTRRVNRGLMAEVHRRHDAGEDRP